MRLRTEIIRITLAMTISLAIGSLAIPAALAEEQRPCLKIKEACEQAGFKQGAAGEGFGLQVDCIRPIIDGAPQKASAGKPLPTVDAAIVAACKAKNPEFGKPRLNGQPGPATSGSDF
jgi:hypothetical protein